MGYIVRCSVIIGVFSTSLARDI
ncbi:hypothetical protein MTR67_017587 [Solanum verrucosum]|uniref:Uncharacterized protein n=1 Tax=Solanum verrucosum TaxID=315347 RepID=A0AAF0TKW3_SOLVR|nr:hypothetical protein MTR67_017587 [Solanum verrucosum]